MNELMTKLADVWDAVVTWGLEHSEQPLFNLAQGLLLGAVLVAAIWAATSAYKSSKKIKRLEAEMEADDEDNT